jgi:hypothetical protein
MLLVALVVESSVVFHHCPHGLGKMLIKKSRNCLNLTGSLQVVVPYTLFVELRLLVEVVGLSRLSPLSSQTWQDVEREVAQLLKLTETQHVAVGPVLVR